MFGAPASAGFGAAAPSITGFSPSSGPVGTSVTINGGGFTGTTAVMFNGTAGTFTVNSDSQITATVPAGATSGPISVTTPSGSVSSGSGSPMAFVGSAVASRTSGGTSLALTIPSGYQTGDLLVAWMSFPDNTSGLSGMSGWTEFSWSPLVDGTTWNVHCFYKIATASEPAPTISWTTKSKPLVEVADWRGVNQSSPFVASAGAVDSSNSTNVVGPALTNTAADAWAVALFSIRTSYSADKGASYASFLPGGLTKRLDANTGAASSAPWAAAAAADSNGAVGPGSHQYTGGTTATKATSHKAGALLYLAPGGGGGSFTVTPSAPSISGFNPSSGPVGTTVTINGSSFSGATAVAFNGTTASYTVNSAGQITATVPTNAATGPISVTTPNGTATSTSNYTVTVAAPSISGFNPSSGPVGTTVTINGSGFSGATAVAFNGTTASYTVNSAGQITATVPTNAATGPISVTTPNGTATSTTNYTVTTSSAPYQVYVGYYDTHHPNNPQTKPSPWMLSPNVAFIGTNDQGNNTVLGNWDTSAVRVDNLTSGPLTVHVTVDIPVAYPGSSTSNHHFDLWGTQAIPAGASLILAQTAYENFDGSDYNSRAGQYGQDPLLCMNPLDISTGIPAVHVTLGTTTTNYLDAGQILNTKGVDGAGCSPPVASPIRDDESTAWTPLY
jgi:hypothetical protein